VRIAQNGFMHQTKTGTSANEQRLRGIVYAVSTTE
jgi:hypothetical protein